MARLWAKHLPKLAERVANLETAAAALTDGTLTRSGREEASSQAHKLAGVLGTFGLHEGTILAREAEAAYLVDPQNNAEIAVRMGEVAAELRAMLSTHR